MTVNELVIKLLHLPNQQQEVTPVLLAEKIGMELYDEKNTIVAYECDRQRCQHKCYECNHTTDIEHAKNFKREHGLYIEEIR